MDISNPSNSRQSSDKLDLGRAGVGGVAVVGFLYKIHHQAWEVGLHPSLTRGGGLWIGAAFPGTGGSGIGAAEGIFAGGGEKRG